MPKYTNALKEYFGFPKFRKNQLSIVRAIIENKRDVCVIMFTGAGKSMCYQFPAVYTGKTSLVVSPLISLMNDQKIKMDDLGISTICLNGTVMNKNKIKEDILNNEYRIVYTTPEYMVTQEDFLTELNDSGNLIAVAIDESHCISSYGHDFRSSYRQLGTLKETLPNVPIIALTATATIQVETDIIKSLKLNDPLIIKTTFDRPNLEIKIFTKSALPMKDLLPLLQDKEPAIVYCQTKKMTDKIAKLLKKNGIICDAYHAGLNTLDREAVHDEFVNNEIDCVVATIAFGMGIDKTIRKVIHYGIPHDMESYYQEIGRAGRDGKDSKCYMYYSMGDINGSDYFINQISDMKYKLHKMRLATIMKKYIHNTGCRRKYILNYFGEKYKRDNCENCDNCINNSKKVMHDFTKEALLFLQVVYDTGNTFGSNTLIEVLRGSSSKKAIKFKKLSVYGKGKDHSVNWWKIFVRMLINMQLIKEESVSGGHGSRPNYGFTLCRTVKGRKWSGIMTGKNIPLSSKNENRLIMRVPNEMIEIGNTSQKDKNIKIAKPVKKTGLAEDTLEVTYELYQKQGMSINDIAKARNLKSQTIENHITKLYQKGNNLDLEKLGYDNKRYKLISQKIKELRYQKQCLAEALELSEIKNSLPKNVTYLQIKLVLVALNKEKDKKQPSFKTKKISEEYKSIMKEHSILLNLT